MDLVLGNATYCLRRSFVGLTSVILGQMERLVRKGHLKWPNENGRASVPALYLPHPAHRLRPLPAGDEGLSTLGNRVWEAAEFDSPHLLQPEM